MEQLFVEIKLESGRTSFRDATQEEIYTANEFKNRRIGILTEIKKLQAEMKALVESTNRIPKVFYDIPGMDYHVRVYVSTGETELI